MVRTGLQRDVHRCAARRLARLCERHHFGMRLPGRLRASLSDDAVVH